MKQRTTIDPQTIAAMFAGERLAIAPEWEERFASGMLPTLLDKRLSDRAARGKSADVWDGDPDSSDMGTMGYQRIGGVGLLEIDGPLLQHGGWFFDGHEGIRAKACAMADDPRVTLGAMRVDSPGGVVAGCFDNVRAVIEAFAEAGKPLVAWCGGNGAFSAGYAWACAASEVSVTDTSGCASVGVLSTMTDRTGMNAQMGVKRIVIRSGAQKADGHPDLPKDDAAVAREQAIVNGMADVFAAIVGESREMKTDEVLSHEGAVYYGDNAVKQGFADKVESFDAFMARCMARAEEIGMKTTAQRLGLAQDASEADIIKAIDALEARAATAENRAKKADEEVDRLGGEFAEFVAAEALIAGKGTKATIDGDKAMLAELPAAKRARGLRDKYSAIERGAALPKETKEPVTPATVVAGPSGGRQDDPAAKLDGGKMTATEVSKYYGTEHFDRLMNEHNAAMRGKHAVAPTANPAGPAVVTRHS